jgi:hypothetical protein
LRKGIAISLLLLLLFNLCGYRFVIASLQKKADTKLEASIDKREYNESDLIEVRMAMNLPYQERYTEFERHYGEVTIDGKAYTYVASKIEGDILILKCIANQSKQVLKNTASEMAKANSGHDQDNNGKKQTSSFTKIFSGDYDDKNQFCMLPLNEWVTVALAKSYADNLPDAVVQTPHQPPKA